MKRALLSILSIVLGLVALGAAQRDWMHEGEGLLEPAAREQSASGSVGRLLGVTRTADEHARAAVRRRLKTEEQGTYISEILHQRDSSLARWPDRTGRPLKVWIQPVSNVADWKSEYVDEVRTAFDEWDVLDLPVSFTFVSDSAQADVHVNWIDQFDQPISGRTKWARDDDWWITDADIVLAVHHHRGEVLDLDAMRAMALHEIGHLLGLDHTSDSSCIMAPKVRVRELSSADVATVRLLYTLPPGAVR